VSLCCCVSACDVSEGCSASSTVKQALEPERLQSPVKFRNPSTRATLRQSTAAPSPQQQCCDNLKCSRLSAWVTHSTHLALQALFAFLKDTAIDSTGEDERRCGCCTELLVVYLWQLHSSIVHVTLSDHFLYEQQASWGGGYPLLIAASNFKCDIS